MLQPPRRARAFAATLTLTAVALAPQALRAQATAVSATPTALAPAAAAPAVEVAAVQPAVPAAAFTLDAARAGVTRPGEPAREAAERAEAARRAGAPSRGGRGLGQPEALMIVGGAALLAGLIIGDDAGTLIAVGGAVTGLFGLYQYLR
jgi:hypothetical protein